MLSFRNCVLALTVFALLTCGSLITSGLADGGANHQTSSTLYGVSGSNANDIGRAFCCGGTLGSLVTDGTTQYILSNNHLLARSDQAVAGEDISQPGLIDNSCRPATTVADFTTAVPLGQNVDAAIAQLRDDTMNTNGEIMDVGIPSATVKDATVGLEVAKSGRTTGFTTGTVSSIDTSVKVRYQKGCNMGRSVIVRYTDQVVVESNTFAAGGDSGSLIVTNDSQHQPVALLFAGSRSATIGNPIGEVLSKLSSQLARTLSFVGSDGGPAAPALQIFQSETQPFLRGGGQVKQLPRQAADRALAALENHRANLMATRGVIGVGVGAAAEDDTEAAIIVYVDRTSSARPQFAASLDGVAVRLIHTDPFVAF
jgi:Peptidase family S64